jgi:hypothetical protein
VAALLGTAYIQSPEHRHSAIVEDLKKGRRVTVLGATGTPAHTRWVIPGDRRSILRADDGAFSIQSRNLDPGLLEVLDDLHNDCLQVSCEIRHDQAYDSGSRAGLYFGQRTYAGSDGMEYWLLTLTFSGFPDISGANPANANQGDNLGWAVEYFRELTGPLRGNIPGLSLSKALTGAPDWIPVKLKISPERVEVDCSEQTDYAVREEIQEKIRLLRRGREQATDVAWKFDPRGPMGFYVSLGQASFRNLVIEPLVAGD